MSAELDQPVSDAPTQTVDVCPLCHSPLHNTLFREPPYELRRCAACGLGYVTPRRSPAALAAMYGADTYWRSTSPKTHGYADYRAEQDRYLRTFRQRLDHALAHGPAGGRALDVGSAAGFCMAALAERGFDVQGVEVSPVIAAYAQQELGFGERVFVGFLDDAPLPEHAYDLICMWDVIEHVPDPVGLLRRARTLLAPGGRLVIETQDLDSRFARLLGRRWHHFKHAEHIYHFNPSSLERLLRDSGFALERLNNGHAGHSGLAYFAGGPIAPAVIAGTATVDPSVNSGAFLNLAVYPDANNRTVTQPVGGPLSFEFWAEFESFREWSRLLDWGSCGGCDNVVIAQNGRGGDNNSPSFSFHLVNGGTTTAPVTTAAPGQVTDCDFSTNGPLHQNEWMHIVCTVSQRNANDSTSLTAADLACYFNGAAALVTSFNYALAPPSTSYTSAGALPNAVTRSNLFLGQSNYGGASNMNFNGWLDMLLVVQLRADRRGRGRALAGAAAAHVRVCGSEQPAPHRHCRRCQLGLHVVGDGHQRQRRRADAAHRRHPAHGVVSPSGSTWRRRRARPLWARASPPSSAMGCRTTCRAAPTATAPGTPSSCGSSWQRPAGASASKILEIGNGAQSQEVVLSLVTTSGTAGSVTFNVYRSDMAAMAAYTVVPTVTFRRVVPPRGGAGTHQHGGHGHGDGLAERRRAAVRQSAVPSERDALAGADRQELVERRDVHRPDAGRLPHVRLLAHAGRGGRAVQPVHSGPAALHHRGHPGSVTQFTAGPQLAYTFDTSPVFATANDAYDTNFTWVQSMTAPNSPPSATKNLTRTGVASFNGVFETGDFVDMTLMPDSLGNTLTFPIGGALSFESSFMYYPAAFVSLAPGHRLQLPLLHQRRAGAGEQQPGLHECRMEPLADAF